MPRAPRIEYPGATFHIQARGNRGEAIFVDREESLRFLSIFEEVCTDHNWDAFAWVLMPDHYQLTVRTNEATLARGMKHLNGHYAQWVNRKRRIDGHLFEGRYTAVVVDADAWLLALVRLSALVPVRAGLAGQAEKWLWGSYRYLVENGVKKPPQYLARGEVLARLDADPGAARLALQEFVNAGRTVEDQAGDVDVLEALLRHNQVLGSRQFALEVQAKTGTGGRLNAAEPRALAAFRDEYSPAARSLAAAYWIGGYRQKDIAEAFSTHISTVSRASAKYREEFEG